jgi:hypothetical protein
LVYIAGTGRSGSTLVGGVLASSPGVVGVGEVRHIWSRGLGQGWLCGCGASFDKCPFWNDVLDDGALHRSNVDLEEVAHSERTLLRVQNSPRALWWAKNQRGLRATHAHYLDVVERLYLSIARVSGAEAIVDTSKNPVYGALVGTLESIDLRVVHLLRDPRATAYSWLNPKPSPDRGPGASMDRLGAVKSAFLWSWWNAITDALWPEASERPVVRVRYESIVFDPEPVLRDIRDRVLPEQAGAPLPLRGSYASLSVTHSVSGNPSRLEVGSIAIKADERWRESLSKQRQAIVLAIAGGDMHRYGYRWGSG